MVEQTQSIERKNEGIASKDKKQVTGNSGRPEEDDEFEDFDQDGTTSFTV